MNSLEYQLILAKAQKAKKFAAEMLKDAEEQLADAKAKQIQMENWITALKGIQALPPSKRNKELLKDIEKHIIKNMYENGFE